MPFSCSTWAKLRVESSAPVVSSHCPWPQTSSRFSVLLQPLQVVAVQVRHVVHRVVEVERVAALPPADPADVVDARQADREREQVGPLQREVRRVVRAEARPGDQDLLEAAAVVVDPRGHVVHHPVLVAAVQLGALLERQVVAAPAPAVERVDRVDLQPAGVDEPGQLGQHPVRLVVPAAAPLRREDQERPAPVAVGHHVALGADPRRPHADVVAPHDHTRPSRSRRWGWNASRQPTQLWPSRFSTSSTA